MRGWGFRRRRGGGGGGGADAGNVVGAVEDRTAFERDLKLDEFRLLAVQHMDQVKILDSWARQTIGVMRNRQTIDGDDPLYTALDIGLRPWAWRMRNILYVQSVPVRQQLADLADSPLEKERMLREGLVSFAFLDRADVQDLLERLEQDVRQAQAVVKVQDAHDAFKYLSAMLVIVPPDAAHRNEPWHHPMELLGNLPNAEQAYAEFNITVK